MILTVEEVLTRIDVRMDGKVYEPVTGAVAVPLGLEGVQVAPLTLEDDQVSFNACLALLDRLDQYDITSLSDVAEEVFPPFAQSILNILERFPEIIDSKRFKPAVDVGAKLFYVYYEHNGAHSELAYQLAEELREFPLPYQPIWLNEYIGKLHTRDFSKFSVETLTHMAQHSLKFQQGMTKDDGALKTVVFATSSDFFMNNGCHTNPFLGALVCSSVNVPVTLAGNLFTRGNVSDREMRTLARQLLKLEGIGVKVPCVAVDYLLVGELIDRFSKVSATTTNNPLQQIRYIRACSVLVDLFVADLDDPKKTGGELFRKRAEAVTKVSENLFSTVLEDFVHLMDSWSKPSPFKASMDRFRRVVIGSALCSQSTCATLQQPIQLAEMLISTMFADCKDDLRDPAFLRFIGKSGRLNAASRISSFNDPEFQKEFVKTNKDLRGAVLENELGL